MNKLKQWRLPPYITIFFIGFALAAFLATLYYKYESFDAEKSERVNNTKMPNANLDKDKSVIDKSKSNITHNTVISEPNETKMSSSSEPAENTDIPPPPIMHPSYQKTSVTSNSTSEEATQSEPISEKNSRDADLNDLNSIIATELFKDVDPESASSINIMTSQKDINRYLMKLKSIPNRSEGLQMYIDIIEKSLEEKKKIEQ